MRLGNNAANFSVVCVDAGRINYKLIFDSGLKDEVMEYMLTKFLGCMSAAEDRCRKVNGGVTHLVGIIDLEGMTIRKGMNPHCKLLKKIENFFIHLILY